MSLYYGDETKTIWHGDCIEVMRTLADNSVDSIVTDPPYGLGFMGKAWDALPPGEEWARECLRVLKPGGHLLAFGGARTWHRLAVAVEDAGFEIRDSIAWMYGSGFPKSLDVSKAIDKARTEDLEPIRAICRAVRAAMDVRDLRSRNLVQHFGDCNPRLIDHWAARDTDSQPALPKWDQWEKLCELFSELTAHDAEVWRLNGRKGSPGEAWDQREVIGERRQRGTQNQTAAAFNTCKSETEAITAPATPAAQQWQGWGTALKPAFEPIVMARKPLIGTVAANVQAHGTGALNIGATRNGERWPANVILDESQADALAESKYFYAAKASKAERPIVDGVAHPTVKPLALMQHLVKLVTPPDGVVLEPFAGSGATVEACMLEGFRCIGIERESEYLPLILERIERQEAA